MVNHTNTFTSAMKITFYYCMYLKIQNIVFQIFIFKFNDENSDSELKLFYLLNFNNIP